MVWWPRRRISWHVSKNTHGGFCSQRAHDDYIMFQAEDANTAIILVNVWTYAVNVTVRVKLPNHEAWYEYAELRRLVRQADLLNTKHGYADDEVHGFVRHAEIKVPRWTLWQAGRRRAVREKMFSSGLLKAIHEDDLLAQRWLQTQDERMSRWDGLWFCA